VRDRSWGEQEKLNELQSAFCITRSSVILLFFLIDMFRLLAFLIGINVEDLQAHITSLLSRTHIEALIHGNVTKDVGVLTLDLLLSPLQCGDVDASSPFPRCACACADGDITECVPIVDLRLRRMLSL